MLRACVQSCVLLMLLLPIAADSNIYNVYNYDTTTPQFTPDGFLKQVEYASSAITHSQPMIVLPLVFDTDPGAVVIMGTISKKQPFQRGQSRFVEMQLAPFSPLSEPSVGSSVVLGLSGIIPDSVSLVQVARRRLRERQSMYGRYRPFFWPGSDIRSSSYRCGSAAACRAAEGVSSAIAETCYERSLGGGIRPFGSLVAACAVDRGEAVVAVSNPSGATMSFRQTSGQESVPGLDVLVIGGEQNIGNMIRREILDKIHDSTGAPSAIRNDRDALCLIQRCLGLVAQSLTEVQGKYDETSVKCAMEGGSSEGKDKDDVDIISRYIDLVLITPGGVHRLNENQVANLLRLQPSTD